MKDTAMKFDLAQASELIRRRRTIYPENFSSRDVDPDVVREILTNAVWAPTHGLTQPWRFVVYSGAGRNPLIGVMDELYKKHTPEDQYIRAKHERMLSRVGASPVIISVAMRRTPNSKIPEIEEVEAVACACQNILLSAAAAGLGAFWSSPKFIYTDEAAEKFGFEPGDKMQGIIYLGHPQGETPTGRRKPLEDFVKWMDD